MDFGVFDPELAIMVLRIQRDDQDLYLGDLLHIAFEMYDVGSYEVKSTFTNSTPPRSELQWAGRDSGTHTYSARLTWTLSDIAYYDYVGNILATKTHNHYFDMVSYQESVSLHDLVPHDKAVVGGVNATGAGKRYFEDLNEFELIPNPVLDYNVVVVSTKRVVVHEPQ